jgi:hypothetical protein
MSKHVSSVNSVEQHNVADPGASPGSVAKRTNQGGKSTLTKGQPASVNATGEKGALSAHSVKSCDGCDG